MLLDAMLWLALALSTAAGVRAVVAIVAERKQKLLIRALDAALREGEHMGGMETFAPEDERSLQLDLEEAVAVAVERAGIIAEASDGDREEREAIMEVDGLFDVEIPEFLRRT